MASRNVSEYDAAIGERAAHIRKVLSMTSQEVAKKLGVTRQTLCNYESGRTPMRAEVVRSLCEVYGVPPTWLLGTTDKLDLKRTTNGRSLEIHVVSPSITLHLAGEDE